MPAISIAVSLNSLDDGAATVASFASTPDVLYLCSLMEVPKRVADAEICIHAIMEA